jgi:hypothetical protein
MHDHDHDETAPYYIIAARLDRIAERLDRRLRTCAAPRGACFDGWHATCVGRISVLRAYATTLRLTRPAEPQGLRTLVLYSAQDARAVRRWTAPRGE